jgi:hypothetical protein
MGSWTSSVSTDASTATINWEGWFDGCYDYLGPESNYGYLTVTINSAEAATKRPTVSTHSVIYSNNATATGNFCILQGNYYVHSCYNTSLPGNWASLYSQISTGL